MAQARPRQHARLHARGAELAGELERYEDGCRLRCIRGPEGTSSRWPISSAERSKQVTPSATTPNIGELDDSWPIFGRR